jgi:PAS domain S-box-containing protein
MAATEIPAFEPAAASDRLRTSVRILFVGVFLALVLLLGVGLWLERSAAIRAGQGRAENLTLILGNHLDRTIAAIDTTLAQLAWHSARVGGAKAGSESWGPVLASAMSGLAGVGSLTVVDETGVITHSTIPGIVGQSRADQLIVRQLSATDSNALAADSPFRSPLNGQWLMPLGRRLPSLDGKFAGAVVATLEPALLHEFYRAVDVGQDGMIWVLHPAGFVLFREPPRAISSEPAPGNPIIARQKGAPASGFVRARFEPEGPAYFNAYRLIANPPLLLAVSLSEKQMLAAWRFHAVVAATIVAVFGVLLIFALRMITREIRARAEVETRIVAQAKQLTAAMNKREEADAALRANEARFESIMHHAPMMVSLKDPQGRYTFVNQAFCEFTGIREAALLGKKVTDFDSGEFAALITRDDRTAIESGRAVQREVTTPKDQGSRTALLVKFPVFDDQGQVTGVGTVMADITDQKRTESQLAQTQRIESIGQLSGGIAHDFNNLLTSILLNADVLASTLDDKLRPLAESIRMAAERGADLTRRLLAFGRRQMLEPRPTDVKDLLGGMEPLMHRTLGEHIEIRWQHAADLWSATVDPGQLENAVLNLAVNARDAMPNGGKLTIETANTEFDAEQAAAYPEIKAGQFVMIAVGDTGSGMPPEVVARAFEPFFTTKDVGKGTGLGLSMVYGFVKQSGGHARIYSEVGIGTVVRLYLPRSAAATETASLAPAATPELPTGNETILFVEDDPMVREHTGRQIVGLGYAVIAAESGVEALTLVDDGYVPDLLFTDVVMPGGINGRQLALRLRKRWPHLRVLYTSGYAHGALTIDGETVPTKYVLGKPYRRRDLAAKLREVLDEPVETV